MPGRFVRWAVLLLLLPGAASAQTAGSWKAERRTVGDTIVVQTLSGSVWGPVRVVEELRIGDPGGVPEYDLAQVASLAVGPDGTISLFDMSVPAIRQYDAAGKYLRTLGREGAGPGEYRNQSLGLLVRRDGTLLQYDPRNGRFNQWDRNGKVLPPVPAATGLYTLSQNVVEDSLGRLYRKVTTATPEPGRFPPIGMLRLQPDGSPEDTIPPPPIPGPDAEAAPFAPTKVAAWHPRGYWIGGYSSRYQLDLFTKPVVRIVKEARPVPLEREERAEWQAYLRAWQPLRGSAANQPVVPVPATKAIYRDIMVGDDGRIWVRLYTRASRTPGPHEPRKVGGVTLPPITWAEPPTYDVFEPDGRYLGQVVFDRRVRPMVARGDRVWGVFSTDDGEQYVVRYRIARGG